MFRKSAEARQAERRNAAAAQTRAALAFKPALAAACPANVRPRSRGRSRSSCLLRGKAEARQAERRTLRLRKLAQRSCSSRICHPRAQRRRAVHRRRQRVWKLKTWQSQGQAGIAHELRGCANSHSAPVAAGFGRRRLSDARPRRGDGTRSSCLLCERAKPKGWPSARAPRLRKRTMCGSSSRLRRPRAQRHQAKQRRWKAVQLLAWRRSRGEEGNAHKRCGCANAGRAAAEAGFAARVLSDAVSLK